MDEMDSNKIKLKDKFICHLVYEHDFIQQFNDMIAKSCDMNEHVFIVYANHAWEETKKYDLKNSYYIESFDDHLLRELVEKASQIVIHCLYTSELTNYLYNNQILLKKANWKLWGGDLYLYRQAGSLNNYEDNERKRKIIIKNLKYITSPIEEEYKHAIEIYGGIAEYRFGSYLQPIDFKDYVFENKDKNKAAINILLGNSGYPSNNHKEALKVLSKFKDEGIKIYCPLSYGEKDYINEICAKGREIFKEKFIPILDFIPYNDYINLLDTMNVVIMNHNRQQGVGNIVASLFLGKKVFLQTEITTYKSFTRLGIELYDVNEIDKINFTRFIEYSSEIGKRNSEIVENTYSNENRIRSWKAIFKEALESKEEKSHRFFLINFHYKDYYSETIKNPSLGAAYILQYLLENGVKTKLYELSFDNDINNLIKEIKNFRPDLIGCSFMSHHYLETYGYINEISKLNIPIVCGGAHVNSQGSVVLTETKANFLIKGEGEKSLLLLLNSLQNKEEYPNIPGLIYEKDGHIKENENVIIDIESLNFPKYKNFNLDRYIDGRILIQTSRGCPYKCTFCQQSSLLGKKWRSRSPQNIMKEMEFWGANGRTNLVFADDNLTLDKKRVRELCSLLLKSKYQFQIETAGVRIDNVDEDTLKIMKEVGFDYLSFGIESGSDRVLKEIKKGITLSQIHKTLELSCKLDYDVKLYFIINNRTETYAEAQESFNLSRQYPITLARFSNLYPLPGTYDYNWILEHGKLLYPPEEYLNNPNEYLYRPMYDGPGMSIEEREQLIKEAKNEAMRFENEESKDNKLEEILGVTGENKNVAAKRVLFINHNIYPFESSGTPITTLNHALGIKRKGLETAVLVPSEEIKESYECTNENGLKIYKLAKFEKYKSFLGFIEPNELEKYLSSLELIIDEFLPDVVHINDYVFMPKEIIGLFAKKGIRIIRSVCNMEEICHQDYPVIFSNDEGKLCSGPETASKCAKCFLTQEMGYEEYEIDLDELKRVTNKIQKRFDYVKNYYEKNVDGAIFTENRFKEYFNSFVKIDPAKCKTILRGISFSDERTIENKTITCSNIRFSYIGNLQFSKGIDLVLKAFENLADVENFQLNIYGGIVNAIYLLRINELEKKYPTKIKYHGPYKKEDLKGISDLTDVAIIPTYFDTYNRIVRELLYFGVPQIVTDFFGSSIILDRTNGLKINVGDKDSLVKAMEELIRNPSIVNKLSIGANRTTIQSIDDEINMIYDFYKEILNNRNNSITKEINEMENYIKEKNTNEISEYVIPAINRRGRNKQNIAKLYYNMGEGYLEANTKISALPNDLSDKIIELVYDLTKIANINSIRFDPIEDEGCLVELFETVLISEEKSIPLLISQNNSALTDEDKFLFRDKDPQIHFNIPKDITGNFKIQIKLMYKTKDEYANALWEVIDSYIDIPKPKELNELTKLAKLYIDEGLGYSEEKSMIYELSNIKSSSIIELDFDLSELDTIKSLRFDPIEESACAIDIELIEFGGNGKQIIPKVSNTNASFMENGFLVFSNLDPQIEFILPEGIKKIENMRIAYKILLR